MNVAMKDGRTIHLICPGDMAQESMRRSQMTPSQFARMLGISEEELESFFQGDYPVTKEFAATLRQATGVPLSQWTAFERQYRHRLAMLAKKDAASEEGE